MPPINALRAAGMLAAVLTCGSYTGPAAAQPAPHNAIRAPAPIVFFDIAAPELAKQAAFYRAIFGWDIGPDGRFTVPAATPLPGNLRVEPAAQGPVAERLIYIGVEDITGTLAQITAAGGSLVFPRLEVQGVAVVAAFKDPAGNRMGLVEMAGGKAKVPPAR